jgi:hypothetical protein
MIFRGVLRIVISLVVPLLLLPACSDGSGTFALPDGCYYAANGRVPVLKIRGNQALILTPGSEVREAQVRPRVNQEGAYLEVSPGFYLRWPEMKAVANGQRMARFRIESREGGSQAILAPIEGASEEELRLGALCRG